MYCVKNIFKIIFEKKIINNIFCFKVTCLITCLLLYWPKFVEFLFISRYFGIGSVFSYFLWLKLLLDLKYRKKFSFREATCPESVFKNSSDHSVTDAGNKVFTRSFHKCKTCSRFALRTSLASFFNNKHFLEKIPVGSCAKSFIFFHFIRFFIHSELEIIFQFVMLHTGLLHFELQARR